MNVHMAEWLWLLEGDWERHGSRFELPDSKSYRVLCLFIFYYYFFKVVFFFDRLSYQWEISAGALERTEGV